MTFPQAQFAAISFCPHHALHLQDAKQTRLAQFFQLPEDAGQIVLRPDVADWLPAPALAAWLGPLLNGVVPERHGSPTCIKKRG